MTFRIELHLEPYLLRSHHNWGNVEPVDVKTDQNNKNAQTHITSFSRAYILSPVVLKSPVLARWNIFVQILLTTMLVSWFHCLGFILILTTRINQFSGHKKGGGGKPPPATPWSFNFLNYFCLRLADDWCATGLRRAKNNVVTRDWRKKRHWSPPEHKYV